MSREGSENPDGWIGATAAAEILHVNPKTISQYARKGLLPYTKTLGGHRRYRESEIREVAGGLRAGLGSGETDTESTKGAATT